MNWKKKLSIALACAMLMQGNGAVTASDSSDLNGHWAKETVENLKSQGYLNGYEDGSFRPNQEVSRAEFVAFVNKMLDLKGEAEVDFKDVKKTDWYYKDLAIALHHGYIKGYENGTFRPNKAVSRVEAAVLITRAGNLEETVASSEPKEQGSQEAAPNLLQDKSIPEWARKEVSTVLKKGIMKGYADNLFKGENKITRAEVAVTLSRVQTTVAEDNKTKQELTEKNKAELKKEPKKEVTKKNLPAPKQPLKKDGKDSAKAKPLPAPVFPAPASMIPPKEAPQQPQPTPKEDKVTKPTSPGQEKPSDSNGNTESSEGKESNKNTDSGENRGTEDNKKSGENTKQTEKKKDSKQQGRPWVDPKNQTQEQIEALVNSLKTSRNDNVTTYVKDGETRAILWTKGITPPNMSMVEGKGDFTKIVNGDYVEYATGYLSGNNWYDVNKIVTNGGDLADAVLCSGAVASNMLHWWMDQNRDHISGYLEKEKNGVIETNNPNSPFRDVRSFFNGATGQSDSAIFKMFTAYFGRTDSSQVGQHGKNGIWADTTIDLFLSNFEPKEKGGVNESGYYKADRLKRGGYFYDVFGENVLTQRMSAQSKLVKTDGMGRDLTMEIKDQLGQGKIVGLEIEGGTVSLHIITMWGAEFNASGDLVAVYITDSDDQENKISGSELIAMRRYELKDQSGKVKLTTKQNSNGEGAAITYLYTLDLGTRYWEAYFNRQAKTN